ncbi:MAG: outer membrane lipoprotein-sorting protein [Burkholderiales bacterium]
MQYSSTCSRRSAACFPGWLLAAVLALNAWVASAQEDPRQEVPRQDAASGSEHQARSILQKADEIRFPAQGFEVAIRIKSIEGGSAPETRDFRVYSKGNDNTIVQTTAPAAERGQILLMKGRDLWLFVPDVSQPVRLSLAQRLTGVVSNGDIARANFSGDYVPKLAGTDKIGDETYLVLDLTAVDRGVTYQRVRYWVRQNGNAPYKAEFYSLSDRLLKTCTYENYKTLGGRVRPTRLVMTDAVKADTRSVMEYAEMKLVDLPDKVFTKEYLKKLQ